MSLISKIILLILLYISNSYTKDFIESDDPNISKLFVSHYDCSKQNNLRQFSLTRVQACEQAPSSIEHTRTIANIYVRAKATRLKAWICNARTKRERFVCAQSDYKYRRHDRTDYHQNTMEHPIILDPAECKRTIRNLNGTGDPELDTYSFNDSFTFFRDIKKQQLLEQYQPPFQIKKLNTPAEGTFVYIVNSHKILKNQNGIKDVCLDKMNTLLKKIAGL